VDTAIIVKLAGLLIPIIAILAPIIIVGVVLYFKQAQRRDLYQTVKHFADRGMPVPRELLDPPKPAQRPGNAPRFIAFSLIGTGLGVALMFALMDLHFLMGIGGLLVFIGLAQLFALQLDEREAEKQRQRGAGSPAADD
jgi:Domain of unknown function (DUF6249)